jgi:hypothetical protein
MMAGIFGALFLAFVLDLAGRARWALACLVLSLALGTGLFLWEIWSPEYGFRMPWLRVELTSSLHRFA